MRPTTATAAATVRTLGTAVGILMALAAAVTVATVVRLGLYARREELEIMTLVGSPLTFIRGPFVAEGVLQGGLGAVLSLPLAAVALNLIRTKMPIGIVKYIPGFESIEMDYTALAASLIMAALSGAVAGITPALRVTRCDVNEVLKEGGRSATDGRTDTRIRSVLLVAEVALAMALLVGTILMVKGVHALTTVNPGSAPGSNGRSSAASYE